MAIHIKDVLKLLECVGEARKILTDLNGDSVVDTVRIRQLIIKIDKLILGAFFARIMAACASRNSTIVISC